MKKVMLTVIVLITMMVSSFGQSGKIVSEIKDYAGITITEDGNNYFWFKDLKYENSVQYDGISWESDWTEDITQLMRNLKSFQNPKNKALKNRGGYDGYQITMEIGFNDYIVHMRYTQSGNILMTCTHGDVVSVTILTDQQVNYLFAKVKS